MMWGWGWGGKEGKRRREGLGELAEDWGGRGGSPGHLAPFTLPSPRCHIPGAPPTVTPRCTNGKHGPQEARVHRYQRARAAPKSWLLNTILHRKGPGLRGETADSSRSKHERGLERRVPQRERVRTGWWRHVRGCGAGLKTSG